MSPQAVWLSPHLGYEIRSDTFNLTYSKVTNVFLHEDVLLLNPSPNTAISIFFPHSSDHVTPLVKTLPSTGSQYPKRKFQTSAWTSKPCDSFLPVWFGLLAPRLSFQVHGRECSPCVQKEGELWVSWLSKIINEPEWSKTKYVVMTHFLNKEAFE